MRNALYQRLSVLLLVKIMLVWTLKFCFFEVPTDYETGPGAGLGDGYNMDNGSRRKELVESS